MKTQKREAVVARNHGHRGQPDPSTPEGQLSVCVCPSSWGRGVPDTSLRICNIRR